MNQVVAALLGALQSMELNRSVKPGAIGALGDLAMAVGPALEPHLAMITMLLDQAASTALPEVRWELSCLSPTIMTRAISFNSFSVPAVSFINRTFSPCLLTWHLQDADEDMVDYVTELRSSVLEAWTGIFQGWNTPEGLPRGELLMVWAHALRKRLAL